MTRPATSARRWEIGAASGFLVLASSGVADGEMRTCAQVVQRTIVADRWWLSSLAEIAPRLPEVLRDYGRLTFDTDAEVRAYAALHLVDRYRRVLQMLERLGATRRQRQG